MAKRRNERTSTRVAKIAGRVLAQKIKGGALVGIWPENSTVAHLVEFRWSDIRALAASALTQAEDKPKLTPAQIVKAAYKRLTPKPRRRARRK